jgi:hypothetical protein
VATAGDSKANCIYATDGGTIEPALSEVEAQLGTTFNCVETFADEDPAWTDWVDPWPIRITSDGWDAWLAASPDHQLVLGLNLVPDSVSPTGYPTDTSWEATCDSGAYDTYATQLAENLVAAGAGNSVIRLGKEFNGDWENDYYGTTNAELTAWVQCYQNEVTAMRAVPGAHFLFDWNPNTCTTVFPLSTGYPGNAYVDIIGGDFYDSDCWTGKTASQEGWNELYTIPGNGLAMNDLVAFANSVGKPISLPEWGIDDGNPDDPAYINGIASIVNDNDTSFQAYFDCACNGIQALGSGIPQATAAYQAAFG